MYKKVTHTIVEEHFGHEMAAEIKKVIDKTIVPPKPKMEPAAASKFKADVENYFVGFNKNIGDIIRAIESPDSMGLPEAEAALFANVDALGNLYKTYYGIEFGEKINQNMRALIFVIIAIVRNLKNKIDIRDWRNRLETIRNDLATTLYQYNNNWRYVDVVSVLVQLFDEYVNYAQNTVNRNQTTMDSSLNKMNNLGSVFASTLVNGTMQQFPGKFIS